MQDQTQSTASSLDQDAVNLAKAIRQTESGGNWKAKGKSGEYGAYQFTEPTWNTYSKKHGVNVPLTQATPEQQNEVAYKQIKEWKDQGLNVGQISSMWNSGKPDAYLDTTYKGVNKSGAKFDVPAYAKSVATAYQEIKNGGQVGLDPANPSSVGGYVSPQNPVQPKSNFVTPPEAPAIDPNQPQQQAPEAPQQGLLSRLGHGAVNVLNSLEKPFVGLAATPVQLLAKLTGHADPYAQGLPGLAGTSVPVTDLSVEKKLGDAAQVASYLVPGEGVLGAVGMGALQGGGSAMSEGGDIASVATGTGLGAASGLVAAGATKLIGKGISKVGNALTDQSTTDAVAGIKKAYSEALNLHANERAFESRTGKDLAQVLMENGATLGKHENGTLDAQAAIDLLQQKLEPLNNQVADLLHNPQGVVRPVNLEEAFNHVSDRINSSKVTELEKEQMIGQARKMLDATARKFGVEMELPTSDLVKQGFWGTTFKRNITSNDALKGNVSYLIGNALKDLEEKAVAGTDTEASLKLLNEQRGALVDAVKRLTKLDGSRLIRGGRVGNMFGGLTGTIVGASQGGIAGGLAGDYFGTKVAEFLNNPANKIAIAQGKAKAAGILPKMLGSKAEPVGQAILKGGSAVQKLARPAGLMGNLMTNMK